VQSVIANQRQRLSKGLASGPPILILPKGETQTAMHTKTIKNEEILNSQPNFDSSKVLSEVTIAKNFSESKMLKIKEIAKSPKAGQNTHCLILSIMLYDSFT
jgi:hypothetical protein